MDPIPSGGGIINGCQTIAFDPDHRPVVTYHKADADGNMQIYATRFEDGRWVQHQLTDWAKPVEFGAQAASDSPGKKGFTTSSSGRRCR